MTAKAKRFVSEQERRAWVAKLPVDWHVASAAAGNTMAGMSTTAEDVKALRKHIASMSLDRDAADPQAAAE
jgi:hypothetical protein